MSATEEIDLADLITYEEAAEKVKVDKSTICKWAAQEPPPFRVFDLSGGIKRISLKSLTAFVASRERKPRAKPAVSSRERPLRYVDAEKVRRLQQRPDGQTL